ncbi:unnamed protein product, partial [Didymodactylos carnosus]
FGEKVSIEQKEEKGPVDLTLDEQTKLRPQIDELCNQLAIKDETIAQLQKENEELSKTLR